MTESSSIPPFNLNHPKNYFGYAIATSIAATTADAAVHSLLETNDEDGKRITRDRDGAADGARALGLVSETTGGETLTELGKRIVSHTNDVYESEQEALAALRELFGRRKRFIEALPTWEPLVQEVLSSHDGIFRLIDLMADVHVSRPDDAFPLPLLVQELYHRDPQFTKACFVVSKKRHRLDELSWGDRGSEVGSTPDFLWERTLYRTSVVHQTKTMLWHAGILTTKGTTRTNLEFSPEAERFQWGLTDAIRRSTVTATGSHSHNVSERFDLEEQARDVKPPERMQSSTSRIIRNTPLIKNLKREYDYRCQICDDQRRQSRAEFYAEGHHLHPLGEGGPDIRANVLIVCPTCHADLDYGMLTIEAERGSVQHGYDPSRDGVVLRTVSSHDIGREYIEYHNDRAESASDEVR